MHFYFASAVFLKIVLFFLSMSSLQCRPAVPKLTIVTVPFCGGLFPALLGAAILDCMILSKSKMAVHGSAKKDGRDILWHPCEFITLPSGTMVRSVGTTRIVDTSPEPCGCFLLVGNISNVFCCVEMKGVRGSLLFKTSKFL